MLPLKIALMWHFHQPYYKKEGEFILPWVRLHGVKDYYDLPELFHEFPNLKQTINIVPSLWLQIEEYIAGTTKDKIQRLSQLEPSSLSIDQKKEIFRLFFLCNLDNMIFPYSRYKELYDKSQVENSIFNFSEQDWLDLQVWYNLTWFGHFSRERGPIKRLFNKGRNFTVEERNYVLDFHIEILKEIKPTLKYLQALEQIEISTSPFYHPILPLLVTSKAVLEATPDMLLPDFEFSFPEDASWQVKSAAEYFLNTIGSYPKGMWPSEGAISNQALSIISKENIKWVASDEDILINSLKDDYKQYYKYFPILYKNQETQISILFRDHTLSDSIGFVYSRWNAFDAATNFCSQLRAIKNNLVNVFGEECLKYAVVPIILDGENCWEFYQNNGIHFQKELFRQLSNSEDFLSVTCSEATTEDNLYFIQPIENIRAGSWINANFKIWAGHQDHRSAWSMLAQARQIIEDSKENIPDEMLKLALQESYISEGSDWFWWYGDEHMAENKADFDVLFRWHIKQIYTYLGIEIPDDVLKPINEYRKHRNFVPPKENISPIINGFLTEPSEWNNAGYYDASSSMSTMHQIGQILQKVWFGSNNEKVFFRCDLIHQLADDDQIEFNFTIPISFSIIINNNKISYYSRSDIGLLFIEFAKKDFIEFSLLKKQLIKDNISDYVSIGLKIITLSKNLEIVYPRQGSLNITI